MGKQGEEAKIQDLDESIKSIEMNPIVNLSHSTQKVMKVLTKKKATNKKKKQPRQDMPKLVEGDPLVDRAVASSLSKLANPSTAHNLNRFIQEKEIMYRLGKKRPNGTSVLCKLGFFEDQSKPELLIHFREYRVVQRGGKEAVYPCQTGIALTVQAWRSLMENIHDINQDINWLIL